MEIKNDPRMGWLVAVARERVPQALVVWLLQSFDALEHTDFGELEPVGVGAPFPSDE